MKKGITLNKYAINTIEMSNPANVAVVHEVSVYNKGEMVIKSVQSDMMKAGKVALTATLVESRKCEIDLDAIYETGAVIEAKADSAEKANKSKKGDK